METPSIVQPLGADDNWYFEDSYPVASPGRPSRLVDGNFLCGETSLGQMPCNQVLPPTPRHSRCPCLADCFNCTSRNSKRTTAFKVIALQIRTVCAVNLASRCVCARIALRVLCGSDGSCERRSSFVDRILCVLMLAIVSV
eukprot:SAG11_NODE_143_length_14870_cov_6.472412_8_plen_141_part_00